MKSTAKLVLWCALCVCLDAGLGWKCLYEEFPTDPERMKGIWWIYATSRKPTSRCLIVEMDPYWNRITQTDYVNFAVELHCSLPWFRHQMVIYTRAKEPSDEVRRTIDKYLQSVLLAETDLRLVDKTTCQNLTEPPSQIWHLSKYMHLDYNPHYVKPLVVDENI